MENTIVAMLIGIVCTFATQSLKKFYFSGRESLLIMSIILAVGYTLFQIFVPAVTQNNVVSFMSQSLTTSVVIYEIFLRNKENGKKQK